MTTFMVDTRELRSFRFKNYTKKLNAIVIQKKAEACICVTDSFSPNERQIWRESLMNKNLIISSIPNQIGRFLFKNEFSRWKEMQNLFKGQIFLIENKKNNVFSIEELKQFLLLKKFFLRIFISKDQLYRKEALRLNISKNISHKTFSSFFVLSMQYQLVCLMYVLELRKKQNENHKTSKS